MSTDDPRSSSETVVTVSRPPGLITAAALVAAEALALLGFAAWMIVQHESEVPSNEQVYSGAVAYLVVFGALVGLVAVSLWRVRGWAYGAAVFLQILALPIAWMMAQEGLWLGAGPLAVAAVVAVVGLMTEPSRRALGRHRWDEPDDADD